MRQIIFLLYFILFFSSCTLSDKKRDKAILHAMDESINNSNRLIQDQSEHIYETLQRKMYDPQSIEKAKIWWPKVVVIKKNSDSTMNYIEGIKNQLKNDAGFQEEGGDVSFKKDDIEIVNKLFVQQGKGEELYRRMIDYYEKVFSVDEELRLTFTKEYVKINTSFTGLADNLKDLTRSFYKNSNGTTVLAFLAKLENNIRIDEYNFVKFCNSRTEFIRDDFSIRFLPFVGLSSNCVKGGEVIQITAGVGTFSGASVPKYLIDGKSVVSDNRGYVIKDFKTQTKPGKYSIPVIITYITPNGLKDSLTKKIEYTVKE